MFGQAAGLLGRLDPVPYWTFGGGTALALRYAHRISYDVDIFLYDAQVLGFLTPRLNDFAAAISHEYREAANGLKIVTARGDIDFIVAGRMTDRLPDAIIVQEVKALVDAPAEILAKKIQYRGIAFARRDIFDLAALMREDPAQVETAIQACTTDAVEAVAQAITNALPRLAADLPDYVNPTPRFRSLIKDASRIVRDFPGVPSARRSGAKRR